MAGSADLFLVISSLAGAGANFLNLYYTFSCYLTQSYSFILTVAGLLLVFDTFNFLNKCLCPYNRALHSAPVQTSKNHFWTKED